MKGSGENSGAAHACVHARSHALIRADGGVDAVSNAMAACAQAAQAAQTSESSAMVYESAQMHVRHEHMPTPDRGHGGERVG